VEKRTKTNFNRGYHYERGKQNKAEDGDDGKKRENAGMTRQTTEHKMRK
jgi:hypothetical protein